MYFTKNSEQQLSTYISDPWHTPASASIRSIQMKSLVYYDEEKKSIVTSESDIRAAAGISFATIFDQKTILIATTTTRISVVTPSPVLKTVFAIATVVLETPIVVTKTV